MSKATFFYQIYRIHTFFDSSWMWDVNSWTVAWRSENCPQVGHSESRPGHCVKYPCGPLISLTSWNAPYKLDIKF